LQIGLGERAVVRKAGAVHEHVDLEPVRPELPRDAARRLRIGEVLRQDLRCDAVLLPQNVAQLGQPGAGSRHQARSLPSAARRLASSSPIHWTRP
jgi:hypothetical protein